MSSGSESDDEYVPGEPEQLSEEDSADDDTEKQYENEQEIKTKKRKATAEKTGKKRQKTTRNRVKEKTPESEDNEEEKESLDPEQEKKREEDLWAMFLDGTDTKPKPKDTNGSTQAINSKIETKTATPKVEVSKTEDDIKNKEKRIFEFAGETIVVENNLIKEKIKTTETPPAISKVGGPSKARSSGGLSDVLGNLNKKNKLTTLEKSKLDWETFKKEQDCEEEIRQINKGKKGYLDRQDFLERADLRQYEMERELRMGRRSNR